MSTVNTSYGINTEKITIKQEVGPRFESPSFLNLISAVFNLMNAVIGAGIIGLAYVASVLGYIQFMFWIGLVLCVKLCLTLLSNFIIYCGSVRKLIFHLRFMLLLMSILQ